MNCEELKEPVSTGIESKIDRVQQEVSFLKTTILEMKEDLAELKHSSKSVSLPPQLNLPSIKPELPSPPTQTTKPKTELPKIEQSPVKTDSQKASNLRAAPKPESFDLAALTKQLESLGINTSK